MADPLSVAASIVGLITIVAQGTKILSEIVKHVRQAPKEWQQASDELKDIERILNQLQVFLLRFESVPQSRASLILVEQVVIILATCVKTFSDVDTFIGSIDVKERAGLINRFKMVSKVETLSEIISRLQMHKASLNLILTILTCQSIIEAESKVDKLCELVEKSLVANAALVSRLQNIESEHPLDDDVNNESDLGKPRIPPSLADGHTLPKTSCTEFNFEKVLMDSRPYETSANNNADGFSIASFGQATGSWSALSGVSLSEISNIAIIAIPIYPKDIENNHRYNFSSQCDIQNTTNTFAAFDFGLSAVELNRSTTLHPNKDAELAVQDWVLNQPLIRSPKVFRINLPESVNTACASVSFMPTPNLVCHLDKIPQIVAMCGHHLLCKLHDETKLFIDKGDPQMIENLSKVFRDFSAPIENTNWAIYSADELASVLLRYLRSLSGPVVPYSSYSRFVALGRMRTEEQSFKRSLTESGLESLLILLISQLPTGSKQLLLYLLHIIASISAKNPHEEWFRDGVCLSLQRTMLSRHPKLAQPFFDKDAQPIMSLLMGAAASQNFWKSAALLRPNENIDFYHVCLNSIRVPFLKDERSGRFIHVGDILSVVENHESRSTNELDLKCGDLLRIVSIFDDGWGLGEQIGALTKDHLIEVKSMSTLHGCHVRNHWYDSENPKRFPMSCVRFPERYHPLWIEKEIERNPPDDHY